MNILQITEETGDEFMPTYDYECSSCGKAFERFQPITAKLIRVCPACGNRTLKRLIGTGAGIIFKGSGFYQTDYRSKSYEKAAQKDKPATDKSDKTSANTCKDSQAGKDS